MKKLAALLMAVVMCSNVLAGCSGNAKPEEASAESTTAKATAAANDTEETKEKQEAQTEAAKGEVQYDIKPGDKVGMSMTDKSEQRWVMDGEKMKECLAEKGFELDLQYAKLEPQTQIAQIENMITTGCKAIIVVPVDSGSLGAVLKKAKEAGVLVINYDLMVLNTPDVDYYIGFDNKQVGKIQAEYIIDRLGLKEGKGPFNIEIFAGSLDEVNAYWYYEEAMKLLQPYIDNGQLVVRSGQTEIEKVTIQGWAPEKTSARMENLVTTYYSNGESLDAVLVPADSIGVPLGNTLKNIGYGTADKPMPIITGNNGNPSAIQSILAGQMSMSIFKDTRNLAQRTADVIEAISKGEELVPDDTTTFDNGVITIPAFLYGMEVIDKDNWKELTIDSGYYTEEQLNIKQ